MTNQRIILKMILLGATSVGKTSLIARYVHNRFETAYAPTLGHDVTIKNLTVDKKEVKLMIFDIGGQDCFKNIRHIFYPGTDLAMMVYDITRVETLKQLEKVWIKELQAFNPKREDRPPTQILVAGNKCDLQEMRMTDQGEGVKIARNIRASGHIETSAKNSINVDEAFHAMVRTYLDRAGELTPS